MTLSLPYLKLSFTYAFRHFIVAGFCIWPIRFFLIEQVLSADIFQQFISRLHSYYACLCSGILFTSFSSQFGCFSRLFPCFWIRNISGGLLYVHCQFSLRQRWKMFCLSTSKYKFRLTLTAAMTLNRSRGEGGKITRFFYERSRNFLANQNYRISPT